MTLSAQDKAIIMDSIRDIHDFPKPGIIFKDITTLLSDKNAYALLMKHLHDRYNALRPAELAKLNAELARNYIRNFQ